MTDDEREAQLAQAALRMVRAHQELALTDNNLRAAAERIVSVGTAVLSALDDPPASPLLGQDEHDLSAASRDARTLFDNLREHDTLRDELRRLKTVLGILP